jgi:DNA-binding protein H-NS
LIHQSTTSESEKRDITDRILFNAYKLLAYIKENQKKIITALCSKFKLIKKDPNKFESLKITNIEPIDVASTSKLLIEARKVPVVDPDPNGEKEYDDAEQTRVAKREANLETLATCKGKEEAPIVEEPEDESEEESDNEKAYSSDESEDNVPIPVLKKIQSEIAVV